MTTLSTPGRRRTLGKGLAAVLAAGLLLAGCGGDGGGTGGGAGGTPPPPPSPPSTRSFEEVEAQAIEGWDACEMFADHLHEFVEFLDYKGFEDDLFSSNGANTAGVRYCEGRAIYFDDPESDSPYSGVQGEIMFGFSRASQEGDSYAPEEYRTPTGRYDEVMQLMRDFYEADTMVERPEDGPWDEATVLLGETGTGGTTLSAFIVDTERDFMLAMSVAGLDPGEFAGEVTWTLEEAAKHFREVSMVNAYQAMVDRYDAAG